MLHLESDWEYVQWNLYSATYLPVVDTLSFYSPFSAPNDTTLFLVQ